MNKLIALVSLSFLSACASIVEGSTQNITVDTNPQMAANCELKNERGDWSVLTPGSVGIKRSKSDLNVNCTAPGYSGELRLSADAESWGIGNVIAGGVIGAGVDAGTGAMFSYDDRITVPMTQLSASPELPVQNNSSKPVIETVPQKR